MERKVNRKQKQNFTLHHEGLAFIYISLTFKIREENREKTEGKVYRKQKQNFTVYHEGLAFIYISLTFKITEENYRKVYFTGSSIYIFEAKCCLIVTVYLGKKCMMTIVAYMYFCFQIDHNTVYSRGRNENFNLNFK